jgi:uncharacterized phage-associated protein
MIRRMTDTPRYRKPALKSTLHAVAWFERQATAEGTRLQPRKLQYLLYMAQGLYAAANNGRALMPSRFLAGSLGPADPNLYGVLEADIHLPELKELESRAEACLGLIQKKFGNLPVEQLESFVEADGIYADVREIAPDAEIPLEQMGPAYRQAFMGGEVAAPTPETRATSRPLPVPKVDQDDLPEGVPKVITGGKPIKRWAPKRRVY